MGGVENLERMLDEFDEFYFSQKENLLPSLLKVHNLDQRKQVLDQFFQAVEAKTGTIQGHSTYRAFKNFYLSSKQFEEQAAQQALNINRMRVTQPASQQTALKDIQNDENSLSPQKRSSNLKEGAEQLIRPKKVKKEDQENSEYFVPSGKENSSRRKKADRKEQRSSTAHSSTQALTKAPETEPSRQHSEEGGAFREMFALKDAQNKSILKNQRQLAKAEEPVETDVTKVIAVDSQVINYGKFICGKILGSTLLIQNTST